MILGIILVLASCSQEASDDFDQFFFRNDGADLFVHVNGNIASNTFILFLHGGPDGSGIGYNTGYFTDEVEKDYAMVYLDQRGNGASTGNYEKETLTIAQNSDDIYELTRFLKARYGQDISFFIAGHSWGGLTSCHALLHNNLQSEVNGWIEISGAHDFIKGDIEAVKLFQELASDEISAGNNADFWSDVLERVNQIDTLNISDEESGYLNTTAFAAEMFLPIADPDLDDSGPAYDSYSPGNSIISQISSSIANPILNSDSELLPLTERLNEITIPSLFLWGKYDLVVPPALGVSAHKLVSTTEKKLVIFEESGHSPMDSEPILFSNEFKAFIELYK